MLLRFVCVLAALEGAATAAPDKAAPVATCPAVHAPSAPHAIQLSIHDNLLTDKPGELPAVSADGTKLAMVFHDEEDFTGAPIRTLIIWNKAGKQIFSITDRDDPHYDDDYKAPPPSKALLADLAKANAALGGTWKSIGMAVPCSDGSLGVGDGVTFRFDDKTHAVVDARGPIKIGFGSPGTRMEPDSKGGCGEVTGLVEAFGSKAFGFVVLKPRIQLGGDSCFGTPSAKLVSIVPVR